MRVPCKGCMCANLEPRHQELHPVRSTEERIIMLANDIVQGRHAGVHQCQHAKVDDPSVIL